MKIEGRIPSVQPVSAHERRVPWRAGLAFLVVGALIGSGLTYAFTKHRATDEVPVDVLTGQGWTEAGIGGIALRVQD
jgi:hypothetical protein